MLLEQQPLTLTAYLEQYNLSKSPCGLETTLQLMDRIAPVPRSSGQEGAMGELLIQIAQENNLQWEQDRIGNVVIFHPGSSGYENVPGMAIQSHQDMVAKADTGKPDPAEYGVKPIILPRKNKRWLSADGTTAGYDNSYGIAASLASALDPHAIHGPLMLIFTVGEETDMRGVNNFGFEINTDKYPVMVNLDNEEEGVAAIGTAAAGYTEITIPIRREKVEEAALLQIIISGTNEDRHSGLDIHKGRTNAVKIIAGALSEIASSENDTDMRLVDLTGDNVKEHIRNSISRETTTTIAVKPDMVERVKGIIGKYKDRVQGENKDNDPDLEITSVEISQEDPVRAMTKQSTSTTIDTLMNLPHGVYRHGEGHPDMVITSTNLAIARSLEDENTLSISMMTRSAFEEELDVKRGEIASLVGEIASEVEQSEIIKGYKAPEDSPVIRLGSDLYKKLFRRELIKKVYHAGAEMGNFGVKFPRLDIFSFGATLKNAHGTTERIYIPSIYRSNRLLWTLAESIAKGGLTKLPTAV